MESMRTITYGPGEMLRAARRYRGEVSFGRLGRQRYAYLLSPQAGEFVFAHDELFRWREAFEVLIPVDGETALIVSDGADHTRRRTLVRPSLAPRRIADYLPIMATTTEEALATTRRGAPFDGYALLRSALRRSTIRSLFGEGLAGHSDRLGEDLQPLLDLASLLPQMTAAHQRLRTPRWRRAMAARDRVDAIVYPEIERARRGESVTPVLARLATTTTEDGDALSDLEVRDQVVSLIAAGYDTTSSALGWALYCLGNDLDLQGRIREEVLAVTGGAPPGPDDVRRLPLLTATITETLRLYPPGVLLPRYVVEDFEYGGRRVRAGTIAVLSPYVIHRDEDIYPDALAFRPERWIDAPRPAPHELFPFGGGAHRCIGSHMATTEMTVMLALLLGQGPVRWVPHRVRASGFAALHPAPGVTLVRD